MSSRTRRFRQWSVSLVAACAAALAACHKDASPVSPPTPASIAPTQGSSAQTATVGQALPSAVTVTVLDASGTPLSGVGVAWTILAGGGSLSATSATTNADGQATVTWTLGTVARVDSLQATTASALTVVVTATAQPGPVMTLQKVAGDQQMVAEGSTSAPIVVQALDQYGNVVPNVAITWVDQNGGALSSTQTMTDASGDATVTLTADPAQETYTIVALDGSIQVTFVETSN